jgi:methylamine dehydrogenase accessory protein MauD
MLIFFVAPTCPICKKMLPVLRSVRTSEQAWLEITLASDGDESEHRAFIDETGLHSFPYVLSTQLGLGYRVERLPFAVLIDATGVIRAKGLVNNREQLESLFNSHETGIRSIQDFLSPSTELLRKSEEYSS